MTFMKMLRTAEDRTNRLPIIRFNLQWLGPRLAFFLTRVGCGAERIALIEELTHNNAMHLTAFPLRSFLASLQTGR